MTQELRSADNRDRSILRSYGTYRLALLLAVIALVSCAALAYRSWAHSRNANEFFGKSAVIPVITKSSLTTQKPINPGERMDIEVITIRPIGFERAEIIRPKGIFGIAVENRSGAPDLELRLDRQGGSRLGQARLARHSLSWKDRFDLAPGRYLLTEANHPDWLCTIIITER